jgi:hypothetical protein
MKHARNDAKRMCVNCNSRPARYRYHGHVRRDRTHVLCFQCYRAVRDSQRLAHPKTFHLGGKPSSTAGPPRGTGRTGTNDS